MSWWSCLESPFLSYVPIIALLFCDCHEISAVPHILFESHMIVSLSLILYDTGLRLRCQQIATHCNSLMCIRCVRVAWLWSRITELDESQPVSSVNCVLVALSLVIIVRRSETEMLYYSWPHVGKLWPWLHVYMTSQIYVIFYGKDSLSIVFWAVIAVRGCLTKATC